MAYANSPLVAYTKLSPNHSGQRTHSIDRITPHCVVGQLSAESICGCFTSTSRQASCNYGIGKDGRVSLCVEEKNRSWCSSSAANDQRAITIECASDLNEPYAMNSAVYTSLIKLCTDICKRNGKTKLLWLGDKDKTLNYAPAADEMVITCHRWFANKSCVPVDTEVLTRTGWVQLHDINVGDEIACASLDGLRVTFEEVLDKVEERRQDTYTSNGLTATKDHRMVYAVQQSKDVFRIDFYKRLLRDGNIIYIPMAGYANCDGLPLTDSMLTFLVAVQADGSYMYDVRKDGTKSYYGVEFHLSKERKIERLFNCLEECHLVYNVTHQSNGTTKIRIYNKDGINIVTDVCEKWLKNKCFTWDWLNLSEKQARFVLDELQLWDGCTAVNLYTSRQQVNLDVISALAAINGVGSNVTGSNIQFRQNPYMTLGEAKRNRSGSQTHVSCVTVKTGIFLCRQHGKTFIIGNCPGDWLYSRLGDLASKVTANLGTSDTPTGLQATSLKDMESAAVVAKVAPLFTANQKQSGILASVSLAQFILESGYGKSELAQNANNCFGMKSSLSGNSWAGSVWDGHSVYTMKTGEQNADGSYVTVTADFRKYSSIEDSIADHSAYLLGAMNGSKKRYEGLAGCTDYKKAVQIIKDGGYATSLDYVQNLCRVIEQWNLTQYDVAVAATPTTTLYRVRKSWSDAASQKGAFCDLSNAKACADKNPGYSVFDENGKVVYSTSTAFQPYTVRVSISDLRIRKGPGTTYGSRGFTGKGVFTIVAEATGKGASKWGLLKSYASKRDGWISLDYAKKV